MTGLGIDFGSRKVKFAALADGGLRWCHDLDTVRFYKEHGRLVDGRLRLDLARLALPEPLPARGLRVVATGYGRNALNLEGARIVPEIRAHVAGASFQTGLDTFTLLDLGGQDTKVARLERGVMTDFVMNDKCAASSGRYLENMAQVLEISLEELSRHWRDPVPLDATCGIFGESELIGRLVEGHALARLCAGVNNTLLRRVLPMLRRYPLDPLVLAGGVALSPALRELLQEATGADIVVPPRPQHNGAIGCAVLALEQPPATPSGKD